MSRCPGYLHLRYPIFTEGAGRVRREGMLVGVVFRHPLSTVLLLATFFSRAGRVRQRTCFLLPSGVYRCGGWLLGVLLRARLLGQFLRDVWSSRWRAVSMWVRVGGGSCVAANDFLIPFSVGPPPFPSYGEGACWCG